jgi:phosphoribosylpyrophosphate synthetase
MSIVLFHCEKMADMAQQVIRNGRGLFTPGEISWERYKEGFPNTVIHNSDRLKFADVAFLACFDSMGAIMEQMWTLSFMIGQYGINSLHLFLPCFPTGTKDRWEEEGEVVTADTLAKTFKLLPLTRSGPTDLTIFDIHALQEESYFPDTVIVGRHTAMDTFREHHLDGLDDVVVVFPDEGARKRYEKYFKGHPRVLCEKRHVGTERVVVIREGDPKGKRAWIIDDLGLSGKTGVETKKALDAAGAASVSYYVSHGMFPGNALERIEQAGFAEIWMSDSWPDTVKKVKGREPYRILPLDTAVTDILTKNHEARQRGSVR